MKPGVFGVATLLGAFLLFQVQPLIGKFILPWFGGATAVWTTCLLFFQVMLLAGYAYAHALTRIRSGRMQVLVHMLVLGVAIFLLPISPGEKWKPVDASDPTWRILGLLVATLGAPYFVLSSTSPLLQAWFYRALPEASPYRLYVLSNIGSLGALVTFPLVFEPLFARRMLSNMWSCAFVAFVAAVAFCGICSSRNEKRAEENAAQLEKPPWWMWVLLPFAGSIMLLATTNKICQDVAVVPFLWILPLALYLLTFIIAFDSPRWYRRVSYFAAFVITSAAVCVVLYKAPYPPLQVQIAAYCCFLFVYCMICHGELYALRPHASRLTAFYLCIALGGAMGGIFVGLFAPFIFNNYFELHIGIVLAPALLAVLLYGERGNRLWKASAAVALALACVLARHITSLNRDVLARTRNFYGVLRVLEYGAATPDAHFRRMNSGDISHGEQFVSPELAMIPTSYYVEPSGIGRALRSIPSGSRRVAIVGLGTGTVAAYARAGDTFRFYEINPACQRFAETQFTFLKRATGQIEVVPGDARLSLEREPPQNYDLLVLDAFSGDSIPVHLLTQEAFAIYLRHLKQTGGLAVHITNRHLHLLPVVRKLAEHHQLKWACLPYAAGQEWWHYSSVWMLLSRDPRFLDHELIRDAALAPPESKDVRLWTDDYASLLPLLKFEAR